jgi:hypothetical protein
VSITQFSTEEYTIKDKACQLKKAKHKANMAVFEPEPSWEGAIVDAEERYCPTAEVNRDV